MRSSKTAHYLLSVAVLATMVVLVLPTPALAQSKPNISHIRRAAEQGDVVAQFNLAVAYRDGSGVSQDLIEAEAWMGFAAYLGSGPDRIDYLQANRELADRLTDAQQADVQKRSTEILRRHSDSGRAWAQFVLAMAHYDGTVVTRDVDQTVRLLQKAAAQSYMPAEFALGMMYFRGAGVPADATKGVEWLRKAAVHGDKDAQLRVGTAFFRGTAVPRDLDQALFWWRKAADQDVPEAQANLGAAYLTGDRGVPLDYRAAAFWYTKAADQGMAGAQSELAGLYEKGLGVIQDLGQALHWYRLAAGGGDALSQFKLGLFYRDGAGVARDLIEAHKWANLASSFAPSDYQKAFADARDAISQLMTPADIVLAQKRAREWTIEFDRFGRVIDMNLLPPPPSPPPPPSTPIRVGGQISPPAKTKHVEAVYPPIAFSARVQGSVNLEVTVNPSGKVVDVKVLGTPQPLLIDAAVSAVKQWEYAPTLLDNAPVSIILTATISFTIK